MRKGLEKRPDRDDLVERMSNVSSLQNNTLNMLDLGNILPDSTAAPSIQGQQKELAKHMRADSLDQKLQGRPKPEDLIGKGILNEDENPTKA